MILLSDCSVFASILYTDKEDFESCYFKVESICQELGWPHLDIDTETIVYLFLNVDSLPSAYLDTDTEAIVYPEEEEETDDSSVQEASLEVIEETTESTDST